MIRSMLLAVMLLFSSVSIAAEEAVSELTTRDGLSGRDIYEGRCAGACHQSPPLRSLTKVQWRIVVSTMQKRMSSRDITPLTDEEVEVLLQYLENPSK